MKKSGGNLKIKKINWPRNTTMKYIAKESQVNVSNGMCTSMFVNCTVYHSHDKGTIECLSTVKRKRNGAHMHNGTWSSLQMGGHSVIWTAWMKILLSAVSGRVRNILSDLIYVLTKVLISESKKKIRRLMIIDNILFENYWEHRLHLLLNNK